MQWHILDNQGQSQALTEEQIRALLRTGVIKRQTPLWTEGMEDWQPAETARPDLFPQLSHASVSRAQHDTVVPPQPVDAPVAIGGTKRRVVRRVAASKPSGGGGLKKVLLLVGGLAVAGAAVAIFKSPRPPGYEALHALEKSMDGATTRGSGETPGEQKAALAMAESAEALRALGITKGSGKTGRGLSGLARKAASGMDADGFNAVCTVKGNTAIFLLHVPDLRKFADDAKEAMGTMAWFAARLGWQELPEPRPARLCVGVKGIAAYDRVMEGPASAPAADSDLSSDIMGAGIATTVTGASDCLKKLCAYFAGPDKK